MRGEIGHWHFTKTVRLGYSKFEIWSFRESSRHQIADSRIDQTIFLDEKARLFSYFVAFLFTRQKSRLSFGLSTRISDNSVRKLVTIVTYVSDKLSSKRTFLV